MNGLLRRLTRRRAATADETPPGTPAASEPVDATVVSHEEGPALSEEERAREEELRRRRRDLPAGLDADRLEAPVGEDARRGAVRRRIRYLAAAREVLLRDLGGFSYEVHRAAARRTAATATSSRRKAGRLAAIDEELRVLEARLGATGPAGTVVRQPGIGGTCPACGELHGSDAGWCSHCGTPLSDRARERAEEATDRAIAERAQREADESAAARPRPRSRRPPRSRASRAQARAGGVHRPHERAARRRRRRPRRGCADHRPRRPRRLGAPPVSTVETPPPPTPVERRCPRCGARLSAEQEWCLECGAAVSTRIAEPRGLARLDRGRRRAARARAGGRDPRHRRARRPGRDDHRGPPDPDADRDRLAPRDADRERRGGRGDARPPPRRRAPAPRAARRPPRTSRSGRAAAPPGRWS